MESDTDTKEHKVTLKKDKLDKASLRTMFRNSFTFASVFAGIFLVIPLTVFTSQIIAIGFYAAWEKYHTVWLLFLIITVGIAVVISSILSIGIPLADLVMRKVVPPNLRAKVEKSIGFVFAIGMTLVLLFMFGSIGYKDAKEKNNRFPELDSNETAAVGEAVKKQSQSLMELAERATEVLNQLSATEQLIQENKQRLGNTLTDIAKQVIYADEASKNMSSLIERQKHIELRTSELERILEGQAPITKTDLDSATKWGWLQGITTSIIATILVVLLTKFVARFRKKTSTSTQEEG